MIKDIVAKRYAKALFHVIGKDPSGKDLERSGKILEDLAAAFRTHTHFRHLMLNPRFDRETRLKVLESILGSIAGGQVRGPLARFVELLVKKNRFQYMTEISKAFAALVNESRGVITVPIYTAKELSQQDRDEVRRSIEALTGRKVQVRWSMDPSLIGGMVVQVGETVVDGSVRGRLEAIRKKLVNT